jgi:two-component system sensor histidine kinase KdpD
LTDQSALKLETPDQGPVLRPAVHVLLWANHAPQRLLRYLWSAGIVIGGTLVAEGLYRAFDLTRLSMVFLATVLLAALHLGRGPALFAAVFAFVIYNFYLVEPRFSFQFASADDFLTLLLFLAVAVGTGNLAGRVRDEVVQRRARERTLSTLFDASRLMSATESVEILRPRIAEAVATAAQACAIVVDEDGSQHSAGIVDGPAEARQLAAELSEEVVAYQEVRTLRAGIWRARPLYADGRAAGRGRLARER